MTKKQQGNFTIFLIITLLILFILTWFIKDEAMRIILGFLFASLASLMHIAIYFNTKRKIKDTSHLNYIKIEQILYSFTTFMLLSISPTNKLLTYLGIENSVINLIPLAIFITLAIITFWFNRKHTKDIRDNLKKLSH